MEYRLYDYGLWTNSEGGVEVNDCWATSTIVDIPEKILQQDKKLVVFLKREGLIRRNIRHRSITIDGETGYTLYFNYKGDPAFELRRVEN